MWDAGVRDPDALFIGRASMSPQELKYAALGGMYTDVAGGVPSLYSGTDSPVGADLLNFFKESDNDLAGAVFDRIAKSERWLFSERLDPESSKQARNGYMADIRAGKPVEKGTGGFVKWVTTSQAQASAIDKRTQTPVEKFTSKAGRGKITQRQAAPLTSMFEHINNEWGLIGKVLTPRLTATEWMSSKTNPRKKKPLMLGGEEVTQEEMDYFHRQVDIQRQNSILNGNKGYPGYPGMADATKNRDDEKEKNMKTDPKKSYGMADGGRLIVPPVSKGSVTNPSENEGMIENYFEEGPYGTPDRKKKGAAKHENKKARPKKKSKKKSKKSRALGGMRN